jgi:membrane protein DedA with SNARE-associated domain
VLFGLVSVEAVLLIKFLLLGESLLFSAGFIASKEWFGLQIITHQFSDQMYPKKTQ